jgi:serine/threonine protein kinase
MERIGRYQIVRELGRGAMGVVYLATDPNIGRAVAIKTIRLNEVEKTDERERLRERLFREARSAGMLSHPGIVTIYDVDQQDDLAFIAMEFVDGPTLDQILSRDVAITPEQMFSVLGQAAVALDYAHQKGIVHRDIKPANIMIAADGTTKITDFGVAKIGTNEHLTRTGTIVGTPHYMSPEQVQGLAVDGRSDQFSLAVVAYEMLTGEKPYTGEQLTTVVYKIVAEDPVAPNRLNPTVAGPIESALRKAMAKRPEVRYPTCQEFAEALEKACATSPGWKTMPRGGSLREPTVADAPQPAVMLPPPARRTREETATVERESSSRVGFWAFLLAIAVAAGLLALLGWQAGPFLGKRSSPQAEQKQTTAPPKAAASQPASPTATPPAAAPTPSSAPPSAAPPAVAAESGKPTPLPPAGPGSSSPGQTAPTETHAELQAAGQGTPTPPPAAADRTAVAEATPLPTRPAPEISPASLPKTRTNVRYPVLVVSSPGGATVTLDDRSDTECRAPCSLDAAPGHHTIAVTLPGYGIEHRDVEVGTGPMELPPVILRSSRRVHRGERPETAAAHSRADQFVPRDLQHHGGKGRQAGIEGGASAQRRAQLPEGYPRPIASVKAFPPGSDLRKFPGAG